MELRCVFHITDVRVAFNIGRPFSQVGIPFAFIEGDSLLLFSISIEKLGLCSSRDYEKFLSIIRVLQIVDLQPRNLARSGMGER